MTNTETQPDLVEFRTSLDLPKPNGTEIRVRDRGLADFIRGFDVHRILDTLTLTLYCPAHHTFFSPVYPQQDSSDTMIEPGHLPDDIGQFTLGHEKPTTESSVPATPKESRLSFKRTRSYTRRRWRDGLGGPRD